MKERRPRVVKLIYQSYLPNQGRYPRVSDQAGILQEDGWDVTVLACDRDCTHPVEDRVDGIFVKRIRVRTKELRGPLGQVAPLLLFYARTIRWFWRRRVDVVICHNLDVLPLGLIVGMMRRSKVIFDAHEPNYYALWPSYLRFMVRVIERIDTTLAKHCDGVTVTNEYQLKKYRRSGCKAVEIIGNFTRPALKISEFDERKYQTTDTVFGRFGTLYPNVGLEPTVAAFRAHWESHRDSRFLLAGRAVDAYREEMQRHIVGLAPQLEYIGAYEADEIPQLYRRIHVSCLVYPKSDWFRNITPTKFFDSLANGVPVIMTDIGGLGEIIRKHRCGIVVDENDIDGIRAAMDRLAQDRNLLVEMAKNAFALQDTLFSWSTLKIRYQKLLRRIYGP